MLSSQIPLFHPLNLHRFPYNFATMTGLIQAMALLRATFDKYAGEEGDKNTLTKAELAKLLRTEFPGRPTTESAVDSFFRMLDNDRDGVVNYTEFVSFVTSLSVISSRK